MLTKKKKFNYFKLLSHGFIMKNKIKITPANKYANDNMSDISDEISYKKLD